VIILNAKSGYISFAISILKINRLSLDYKRQTIVVLSAGSTKKGKYTNG
jgi:hypothetical protein